MSQLVIWAMIPPEDREMSERTQCYPFVELVSEYAIGERIWFKGNEYRITSAPFELHGGRFQEAENADGQIVVKAGNKL